MELWELPTELLLRIISRLPVQYRLIVGVTCRGLLRLVQQEFSRVTDVRLILEDDQCLEPIVSFDLVGSRYVMNVSVCQCEPHFRNHLHYMRCFFEVVGPHLRQVMIEDYLLRRGASLRNETLELVLRRGALIECLELHHVDLSSVKRNTLEERLIALRHLTQLAFLQCAQPARCALDDRLIVKIARKGAIQQLRATACNTITDRSLRYLAKFAPNLWSVDLSFCRQISARGVAYFCEHMGARQPDLFYVKVAGTELTGHELRYHLFKRPVVRVRAGRTNDDDYDGELIEWDRLAGTHQWILTQFDMDLGGRRACSVQNSMLPTKTVLILV